MRIAPRIYSPESMISAIRHFGVIPFFKGKIPGWSVEELTDPECWFTTSEQLGPWDWKIDTVREGDIAYGKFLCNKAAFSTAEWYRHMMNWRRSLPKYRIPLGEKYTANTLMNRLYEVLSPTLLNIIKENGTLDGSEMRQLLQEQVHEETLRKVGGSLEKYLLPKIKRTAVDFLLLYLEMGTWSVKGDFKRVYKGPNLEYHGWQRSSHTLPELLFGTDTYIDENAPSWAKIFSAGENETHTPLSLECSPEESLSLLIEHIREVTGFQDEKIIRAILE